MGVVSHLSAVTGTAVSQIVGLIGGPRSRDLIAPRIGMGGHGRAKGERQRDGGKNAVHGWFSNVIGWLALSGRRRSVFRLSDLSGVRS